ncbi:hypothetical protein GGR52DRAFT_590230 [Hypoxylon sp. FL1284]|nr:hypothetical protein GGR52DRAFT_590230 [Hypoxylon sp. FL1284]
MLLFFITASLVWHLVLAFFVALDVRLLLRITRWAVSIYLVLFGLFIAEVLREGLAVNGAAPLDWDARLAWALWFALVAAGVADWRFLVPAAALPLYVLSFPEARTLLNYGLVRLGWLELVHSPVAFAVTRAGGLVQLARAGDRVSGAVADAVRPVAGMVRGLLDLAVAWSPWTGPGMEKLRPAGLWDGFLLWEW